MLDDIEAPSRATTPGDVSGDRAVTPLTPVGFLQDAATPQTPLGLSRPLPTGNELMSGPIKEGGPTRQEKEIEFVMGNIEDRLTSLKNDENFTVKKWLLFSLSCFSLMGGVTLILFGFHMTFFFEKYDDNIVAVVFGSIFCTPVFYWFYWVFIPNKKEVKRRMKIHVDRADRRKPTLFNSLVEDARKATEPPVKRIRILAHIRKHDYPIVASTMLELCTAIQNQCGLAVERQLLRHNDVDLDIHLDKKLDVYYNLEDNSRVYVYNKGGYFTADSPLKKAKTMDLLKKLQAEEGEKSDGGGGPPGSRGSTAGGRTSLNDGRSSMNDGRSSMNDSSTPRKSGNSSMNGLKSAMSDSNRKSLGEDGRPSTKGKISWK
mmetsp:Transcript_4974/g.8106  ORF Transcript_4974/g.8106 Transcript_4974/m.8106 type:complete len:374 (+) Transcript_4974:108-1229(+)